MLDNRIVSVSGVVDRIQRVLLNDGPLSNFSVRGEVVALNKVRDYLYFTLKEGKDQLSCVAWDRVAPFLVDFKNGDSVIASGSIAIYRARSTYQLNVKSLKIDGIGDAAARIERLKKKLAAEGLFEQSRKIELPRIPFDVAIISSSKAQGYNDFIKIQRESAAYVRVTLVESSVQGNRAAGELVSAIRQADTLNVDLIVILRGGGSPEDLLVFSDESVVRAVAECRVPIATGIGHDYDMSLADFAADAYAKTPSDAAHTLLRSTESLTSNLDVLTRRRAAALARVISSKNAILERQIRRTVLSDSALLLAGRFQLVVEFEQRSRGALAELLRLSNQRARLATRALEPFGPEARLAEMRGKMDLTKMRLANAFKSNIGVGFERVASLSSQLAPALRVRIGNGQSRLNGAQNAIGSASKFVVVGYVNRFGRVRSALHPAFQRAAQTRQKHLLSLTERFWRIRPERRIVADRDLLRTVRSDLRRGALSVVQDSAVRLNAITNALHREFEQLITKAESGYKISAGKLDSVSPEAILERGYAIVRTGGKILRSANEVGIGAEIEVTLAKGSVVALTTRRGEDGAE